MKSYQSILSRCGWVLVGVGLTDIALMVWCIANKMNYASSLNIFAVIAGIFLLKGSLKAAWSTSFFMAFLIAGFVGFFAAMPFFFPLDLIMIYWKNQPKLSVALAAIVAVLVMAILVWIYRELTSHPVRVAMDQAQLKYTSFWRKPARGFWAGGCLIALLFIVLSASMGGKTAQLAKQKAAVQAGPDYKFYVRSLSTFSSNGVKRVRATVTAYRDAEIKDIVVEWTE